MNGLRFRIVILDENQTVGAFAIVIIRGHLEKIPAFNLHHKVASILAVFFIAQ